MGKSEKANSNEVGKAESERAESLMRANWEIDSELSEFESIDTKIPYKFAIACLVVAAALFAVGYSGLSGTISDFLYWAALVFAAAIVLTLLVFSGSIVRTRRMLKLSAIEANKEIKVELIRWLAGGPDEAVVKLVIGDSDGSADKEGNADEEDTSGAADADSPSTASAMAAESDALDGPSGSSAKPSAQSGDPAVEPSQKPAT